MNVLRCFFACFSNKRKSPLHRENVVVFLFEIMKLIPTIRHDFLGDDLPDFTAVPYQVAWSQSEEVFGRSFFVRKGGMRLGKNNKKTLVKRPGKIQKCSKFRGLFGLNFGWSGHYVSSWAAGRTLGGRKPPFNKWGPLQLWPILGIHVSFPGV